MLMLLLGFVCCSSCQRETKMVLCAMTTQTQCNHSSPIVGSLYTIKTIMPKLDYLTHTQIVKFGGTS